MERLFLVLAGVNGFLAVAAGAFGAHGLGRMLGEVEDGAKRLGWWETAAQYHLTHALALAVAGWLVSRATGTSATVAGVAFQGGVLVFSGTLYAMALGGPRWLGAITPIGGTALLVGWAAVAWAAVRMR